MIYLILIVIICQSLTFMLLQEVQNDVRQLDNNCKNSNETSTIKNKIVDKYNNVNSITKAKADAFNEVMNTLSNEDKQKVIDHFKQRLLKQIDKMIEEQNQMIENK